MSETPEELRKRLKDARIEEQHIGGSATSGGYDIPLSATSSDVERYIPDGLSTDKRDERPVSGLHNGVRRAKRATNNSEREFADRLRSIAQIDSGKRSGSRRSGPNNGENWSDGIDVSAGITEGKRTVGNLEADGPIPRRYFGTNVEATLETKEPEAQGIEAKRKPGRPAKPRAINLVPIDKEKQTITDRLKQRTPNFLKGSTLTKQEAAELEEPLIKALTDELELLDKAVLSLVDDPLQQPVWGDMSEKEVQSIAHVLLKTGQKSPVMASVARTSVDGSDYIAAGAVILPRFKKTVDIIRDHRKKDQIVQAENRRERIRRLSSSN